MWRFIAQSLDRLAIRSARGSVLPSPDGQAHATEASELLRRPDFFSPTVEAARVEFASAHEFRFASLVRSECANNNVVRGRFVPAALDWRTRPSVILLHGWNAELQHAWLCPVWGRMLARAGVNAFMFELPFHGARRPTEPDAIRNFLSGHLPHVMRATHQSLADVRALSLWLRTQGSPSGACGACLLAHIQSHRGFVRRHYPLRLLCRERACLHTAHARGGFVRLEQPRQHGKLARRLQHGEISQTRPSAT